MQCKKALEEAEGDLEKAVVLLHKQSGSIAEKKSGRELGAGAVQAYIHGTGTVGVMVELLCETDFVARNEDFKQLAYDIAMHVAATSPQFLKEEDITEADRVKVREVFQKEVDESGDKPADVKEKMLQGKMDAFFNEKVLLKQDFVKDGEKTIEQLIEQGIQKFGEKIAIGRFVRFSI